MTQEQRWIQARSNQSGRDAGLIQSLSSGRAPAGAGAIAPVAVGVLVELGVADPVPTLHVPSVLHQLQESFWGGAEARRKQVGGFKQPAVTGADSGLTDVHWGRFGRQGAGDVTAMGNLVIRGSEWDVPLYVELRSDLAVQRLLLALPLRRSLGLRAQQDVGPLLLALPKNGRWAWRASAWISTPSRSSSQSSCLSTARSWFSPVA